MVLTLPAFALPSDVYFQNCSSCHGADRLGGVGPALLPENLSRLKKPEAARMIRDSRPGVQMPAFKDVGDDKQVAQLVELIYSPVVPAPRWASRDPRLQGSSRNPSPASKPCSRQTPSTSSWWSRPATTT